MSIKLILSPLDGSERSVQAMCTAQIVAKRFGSHIKAVHVREKAPEPYLFSNLPASLKGNFEKVSKDASNDLADKVTAQFESFVNEYEIVRSEGVLATDQVSASLHVFDGSAGEVLIREGRLVDVITIARPESHQIGGSLVGERLESLLMNTGRPVLVVPPDWSSRRVEHAAIGWNGSIEASRALSMTLPWLTQMKRVSVVTSTKRRESADQVVEYLSLHGCVADIQYLSEKQSSVGKGMLNVCAEIGAEFLVVGGFSHTRAHQRFFGGVTSYLLKNTNVITVMVH
jgi:nucleotide-binding universal stress UspA family protein